MIRRSWFLPLFLFLLIIASHLQKTYQVADHKDINLSSSSSVHRAITGNPTIKLAGVVGGGARGIGGIGGGGARGVVAGGGRVGGGGSIGRGGGAGRGGGSTEDGYERSTGGGSAGRTIPCQAAACGGGSYTPRHKNGGELGRSCGGRVAAVIAAATWALL